MDGACVPCLAVKMLTGEGSLLMLGGCHNPLGPPVNLWTTVGWQYLTRPLCEVCVSNVFCVIVSVTVTLSRCHGLLMNVHEESNSNTSSMMSWSVRFLLVAKLLNAVGT
jgi:hypothetical protein